MTPTKPVASVDNESAFVKQPKYTVAYSRDGKHVRIVESNGKEHVWEIIERPDDPGRCVLEDKMLMPKNDKRHNQYLEIFESMRANARNVLGKDGLNVLWSKIPVETRADILNMTSNKNPILKRFRDGWAGSKILVRVLQNARNRAARKKKTNTATSKSNKKVAKKAVKERGTTMKNQAWRQTLVPLVLSHARRTKGEEEWLPKPIAQVTSDETGHATNSSTKPRRKGAPTKPTVIQNGESSEDEQIPPVKSTRQPSPKTTKKLGTIRTEPLTSDSENGDEDEGTPTIQPAKPSARPLRRRRHQTRATTKTKTRSKSLPNPRSKKKLRESTGSETENPQVAPSGRGSKRKRTEQDEDESEHTPREPRAASPAPPTVQEPSSDFPSTVRDTSPAPTEVLSTPIPVQNKKRKGKALDREESESWDANVNAEIAKLEANNRDAKKGKRASDEPSDKPAPSKNGGSKKPRQGKKATQHLEQDQAVEETESTRRKRPTPRPLREAGAADEADLFVVSRKAKKELVDEVDIGGSKRITRNRGNRK
ncbi:unnamed protein product [Rhizoctonia solani]|uniref:Uncharacterized protein n=1 Tax=Rhizoctonia solani TaxID=456999 RepID=A0A8H3DY97_9AGAM|nr:unnamed protein product [Rhizoctonia solani]